MLASQNGHHKVIELLLKEHVDINHQGNKRWSDWSSAGLVKMIITRSLNYYMLTLILKKRWMDCSNAS